jgi:hypothetical protein
LAGAGAGADAGAGGAGVVGGGLAALARRSGGGPDHVLWPAPEDVLRLWPVDKKVGNVRNDGPDLIKPIAEREPTLL